MSAVQAQGDSSQGNGGATTADSTITMGQEANGTTTSAGTSDVPLVNTFRGTLLVAGFSALFTLL